MNKKGFFIMMAVGFLFVVGGAMLLNSNAGSDTQAIAYNAVWGVINMDDGRNACNPKINPLLANDRRNCENIYYYPAFPKTTGGRTNCEWNIPKVASASCLNDAGGACPFACGFGEKTSISCFVIPSFYQPESCGPSAGFRCRHSIKKGPPYCAYDTGCEMKPIIPCKDGFVCMMRPVFPGDRCGPKSDSDSDSFPTCDYKKEIRTTATCSCAGVPLEECAGKKITCSKRLILMDGRGSCRMRGDSSGSYLNITAS